MNHKFVTDSVITEALRLSMMPANPAAALWALKEIVVIRVSIQGEGGKGVGRLGESREEFIHAF